MSQHPVITTDEALSDCTILSEVNMLLNWHCSAFAQQVKTLRNDMILLSDITHYAWTPRSSWQKEIIALPFKSPSKAFRACMLKTVLLPATATHVCAVKH